MVLWERFEDLEKYKKCVQLLQVPATVDGARTVHSE